MDTNPGREAFNIGPPTRLSGRHGDTLDGRTV